MQEEIGTGGGGFRFIYGAFLQEAHAYHPNDELMEISKQFTKSGDIWRSAAVQAAGIYKGRIGSQADFNVMSDYLMHVRRYRKTGFSGTLKNKVAGMSHLCHKDSGPGISISPAGRYLFQKF